MGKKAKEHRKKVARRNEQIKQAQAKYQKMQKEMLMQLIEQEKQKGLFDNMPQIPNVPQIGSDPLSDQQLII